MKKVPVDARGQEKGAFQMHKQYELRRHVGGKALAGH